MYHVLQQRLNRLLEAGQKRLLTGGLKGIEKESLRVTRDGHIARTPHPVGLGSALTHPYITTDYSEALLEFRTPPFAEISAALDFLSQIHKFVYTKLGHELLWATSMPCAIEGETSVPIADYGSSNVGTMKHVYRRGLQYRYGGAMQAIAGVHFNYSLPEQFWPAFQEIENDSQTLKDFISNSYFSLIRNFQRQGWLVPYLFGTSPAVCKSFLRVAPPGFADFDAHTYFKPNATSLRMSDIGYKNKVQAKLEISYNAVEDYINSLIQAIETPYPEYEKIGVIVDGEYRQLNTNILQIENEYYSFVRPKQVAQSGEKPTLALRRRGVQYVEIRALDVDSFDPLGVNEDQLRFMEAFLIFCLLAESPPMTTEEQREFEYDQRLVACGGRDPSLMLRRHGKQQSPRQWAAEICEEMQPVAELLDQGASDRPYANALAAHIPAIEDPERTSSARVLREMRGNKQSFLGFAQQMSERHERHFQQMTIPADRMVYFEDVARESLQRQSEIEAADRMSFQAYLDQYFAQR